VEAVIAAVALTLAAVAATQVAVAMAAATTNLRNIKLTFYR
jgi:hypothetical protein